VKEAWFEHSQDIRGSASDGQMLQSNMWIIAAAHLDSAPVLCLGHYVADLVECLYFTSIRRLAVLAGLSKLTLWVLCGREKFRIR